VLNQSSVFVQTKVASCQPGQSSTECAAATVALFQQNLQQLSLQQVDSVMLHFPPLSISMSPAPTSVMTCSEAAGRGGAAVSTCALVRAQWGVLERLLAENVTRAIGVSNYCASCLG
jgi:diketogulonate reductase-like aldo/keto reductase